MLSVVAAQMKRRRDEIDEEFDAVYKAEQEKRGIKYNGLYLVGQEPVQPVAAAKPAKLSMRQRLEALVFGDVRA